MTCQVYQQQLVTYLHGRLEADQRGELETHLKGCAMCAQELEEFKQLEGALRDFANMAPPDPEKTLAAVNAKIDAWEARQAQRVGVNRLVRYGLAVAAAAILVVVVSRPLVVKMGYDTKEQTTQSHGMRWEAETPPAIHLQWIVADQREATTALSEWLTPIQGARLIVAGEQPWRSYLSRDTAHNEPIPSDAGHVVVQLPASQYPALLAELAKHGQLSSQPPAPEAVSTDQPLTVELSLVVQTP